MSEQKETYHKTILSSGLFGFFQILNVVLGIIRSKVTALLIGAEGIGVVGLLQSIIDLIRSSTGMGLETSATKEIAVNQSDEKYRNISTIKFLYFATAILGILVCIIFSKQLSEKAFGNDEFQSWVIYLSLTVLFVTLTAWITSILQGLKQIKYMAYASTLGSLLSFLALVPAYYFFGIQGIVPMYIGTNFIVFIVYYFYYQRLKLPHLKLSLKEILSRSKKILLLGGYMVLGGFIFSGSLLFIKAFINDSNGLKFAGIYQAIWAITALFWSMILRITNSYYFPKLCELVEKDRKEAQSYINKQTTFVMVVILPVILILFTFSKYILYLLYSREFMFEHHTLSLHFIASYYKIIITPLALVMIAKSRGVHFVCTEFLFWIVYLVIFYFSYPRLGLLATGVAYLCSYIVYIPIIAFVTYKYDKQALVRTQYINLIIITLVFIVFGTIYFLNPPNAILIQCILIFIISIVCLWRANKFISFRDMFSKMNSN